MGDIYVGVGKVLFHDRRIPLPRFQEMGLGKIPVPVVPRSWLEMLDATPGVVSTGDSFTPTLEELEFFGEEQVACKDMEAAAIAALSRDLDIRVLLVKAVTDLVDHPEPEEIAFERNLERTCDVLEDRLVRLIEGLSCGS